MFFLLLFIFITNSYTLFNEKKQISITYNLKNKININKKNIVDELKNKYNNNNIIAFLKINDDISTPLVQTNNNDYYLTHSYDNTYLKTGSVFIDYRNNIFTDKKIIIYGHNSNKYNIPFKHLKNYLSYDYFQNNKYVTLITNDYEYKYKIFSIFITKDDYEFSNLSFLNNNYLNHLNYLKDKSIFKENINLSLNDNIIIMQTCMNDKENNLLIICGRKEN